MIVALVAHVALTTPFISLPVTHPLVNRSPLLFWYQIKAMFSQPHLLLGVAMEQVMLGTGKGKGVGILGNHHGGVRPHPSQGMDRSCDGWALPRCPGVESNLEDNCHVLGRWSWNKEGVWDRPPLYSFCELEKFTPTMWSGVMLEQTEPSLGGHLS